MPFYAFKEKDITKRIINLTTYKLKTLLHINQT